MRRPEFTLKNSPTAWSAKNEDSDVTSIRISNDDKTVAIGCFNGNVYIRDLETSRLMYRIQAVKSASPITSIRWHPYIMNTIICASASGIVSSWHTETGQNLWTIQEQDNSINSVDVATTGKHFATCGSDCTLRYYNITTKQLVSELASKKYIQGKVTGHEMRIFSNVFMDENVIASSGWDDTVLLWDVRSGDVARLIFGTHVCGEAMSFTANNKMLATGSWRTHDQLQFWDVGTGKIIKSITIENKKKETALQIYSLAISKKKDCVAVAGDGMNCLAVYSTDTFSKIGRTDSYESCISSVHFGTNRFAYGMTDSSVICDKYTYS